MKVAIIYRHIVRANYCVTETSVKKVVEIPPVVVSVGTESEWARAHASDCDDSVQSNPAYDGMIVHHTYTIQEVVCSR
jgi:hypothetical protein